MFRNIYIESYKNAIQQSNSLEMMLLHANYIHSLMGCILQDIEFMIASSLMTKKEETDKLSMKAIDSRPSSIVERPQDLGLKINEAAYVPTKIVKADFDLYNKLNN